MPRLGDIEAESRIFKGKWQTWRKTAKNGKQACQNVTRGKFPDAAGGALTRRIVAIGPPRGALAFATSFFVFLQERPCFSRSSLPSTGLRLHGGASLRRFRPT